MAPKDLGFVSAKAAQRAAATTCGWDRAGGPTSERHGGTGLQAGEDGRLVVATARRAVFACHGPQGLGIRSAKAAQRAAATILRSRVKQ